VEEGAAMSRILTLHLDEFCLEALTQSARRWKGSAGWMMSLAARYYLANRGARTAWRMPRFRLMGDTRRGTPVYVRLDDRIWPALDAEAELQGVTAAELGEHAVLYFLADLDRGAPRALALRPFCRN
jgi:hypothetical protein